MADIPEKYSDLDFVPPKAAQKNAKKALRWKEEHSDEVDGGTRVGWTRANQLAKGQELSPDIVDRMAQFNRHRSNSEIADEYEGEPWKDNGYVAWLIWGGDEGVDWAIRKADAMDKRDKEQNESVDPVDEFIGRSENKRKKKSTSMQKEKKLRSLIRDHVRETIFGKELDPRNYSDDSDEKITSYNSRSAKIMFYEEGEDKVYMRILNKKTGDMSDKIYLDNVENFLNVLDRVSIIT